MKTKLFFFSILLSLAMACGKSADYSSEFITETTGSYKFNANEVIEVYFVEKELFLKWRGAEKIEPLYLGNNTYFIKEMNKKIEFVKPNNSSDYVISEVVEVDEDKAQISYKKLADSVQVPSVYLKNKNYAKATEGYLQIQKEDSTSPFIKESVFNRKGYYELSRENLTEAIEIFKINVALYPESSNVYDSLAEAYVRNGDSLEAYQNYKKALEYNTGNKRAKRFITAFEKK